MAQTYGDAVRCEAIRDDVFEGKKSPMIFGQPEQWLALLIESLLLAGRGEHERIQRAARPAPSTKRRHRRRYRRPAVRLDRRRRFAARPGARGGHQRPLLLGAVLAVDQDRPRTAGRPARHGLDAGAPPVRERRRVGGAHSDPLSRVGGGRRRPDRRWRGRPSGRRSRRTPTAASVNASSPPTPTTCRSWRSAPSSLDRHRRDRQRSRRRSWLSSFRPRIGCSPRCSIA